MPLTEEKDISDNHEQVRSSASEDLETCPLTGDDSSSSHGRRRRLSWLKDGNLLWKYYSLFMTVFSLLLLVTTIHYGASSKTCAEIEERLLSPHLDESATGSHYASDTWKHQNLVKTRFFRDLRYMSLDHETDYLWKEHQLMSTGNIRLPDGKGNTSLKGIAM